MIKHIFYSVLILCGMNAFAQEATTYQQPPKEIMELIDVPMAPGIRLDNKSETMLFYYRDSYQSIEHLSQTELRLAGLRINPKTNIGSRTRFYNDLELGSTKNTKRTKITGLPSNPQMSNFQFSPDDKYISFTNTTTEGVELWLVDVRKASASKLTEAIINANIRGSVVWARDSESLLIKTLPTNRAKLIDTDIQVPSGPIISESDGEKAQNRTYQDLLKSPNDEKNFEILAHAEIKKISLDGSAQDFLPSAMYRSISYSPDGNYLLVSTIKRPFSYLVPYHRFPTIEKVYTADGQEVATVNEVPLIEVLPQGFMSTTDGKRSLGWRNDKPATLYWVEALDGGDPEVEVPYRDAVYQVNAPFTGEKELLVKTINRYAGITWGNDTYAIAMDRWFSNRNTKTYVFNPSNNQEEPTILFDRSYQDTYSDPGSFVSTLNKYGVSVLDLDRSTAYLIGDGFSDKGQFPFIDAINLENGKLNRLYESEYTDKVENILRAIDLKKGTVLVRIESQNEYPNYYIRNINRKNSLTQITDFDNPFKSLSEVHKEVITYPREDGLELTGTLYLPAGYDGKEKLPMILWAYPREYKDRSTASQTTSNPNRFVAPNYGSPIFWVTQGYVVLDNAAFPIVGEENEEPNDSFTEQLVANAKAAIDAVDKLGYVDRNRVGVGGHSYGAFMTANLLSHSDLFAAGIARSGAYNRTLTPFGFQSEERNYWEAPDLYNTMSPFMNAEKVKAPILLIHGAEDNNSGTYPMQSERYFNALKGLGIVSRLVMLPKESHGYAAKESILHMLWEQHNWLEKYVKNKE
ncbi:MAG TPA: prolyl oligopeptidase family serine peptidase [Flavobacteriaceae bacterium]|nr:prolyl oligopeptidase family serine peptidase [Flavobacteriaceae bacterium]